MSPSSLILLTLPIAIVAWGTLQSVSVKGRFTCSGGNSSYLKVKLYDNGVFLDTLLMQGTTDSQGRFSLRGNKTEISTLDPKVNVYHKCNYEGICLKKLSVKIPKDYVSEGASPEKTFDIGEVNLAGAFSGQSIDCIN